MLPLRERSRSGNGRLVQRIPVLCSSQRRSTMVPSEPNCRAFHVKSSINLQLHRRPGICQRLARESLPRVEPDVTPMTRIFAIEPNPERAQALRQLIHDRLGADLVLADSTAAAIAAMTKQGADLILTSILLPPNDDSQLTNYLRECDQAGKVPVLLIPPVIEDHQTLMPKPWWSRLARSRKGSPPWPPYDPEAGAGRIRDAVLSMDEVESLVDDGQSAPATVTALVCFDKTPKNG